MTSPLKFALRANDTQECVSYREWRGMGSCFIAFTKMKKIWANAIKQDLTPNLAMGNGNDDKKAELKKALDDASIVYTAKEYG